MKDRNISKFEFFQALQREYISCDIRSKIYVHKRDRTYFKSLMDKKSKMILSFSKLNSLCNILESEDEYLKIWNEMVPDFGFPKLIYNITNVSDKQLSFFYKGVVVCVDDYIYGISEGVYKDKVVVDVNGNKKQYECSRVVRVDHKTTDEYFYYYPNNYFKIKDIGVGVLQDYDFLHKEASLFLDGQIITTFKADQISRIL